MSVLISEKKEILPQVDKKQDLARRLMPFSFVPGIFTDSGIEKMNQKGNFFLTALGI